MTPATQLRNELAALGVTLAADGDRLRFYPRDAVTPELLTRLRDCKAELLGMVASGPQDGNGYTTHATTGETGVVSPAVPHDPPGADPLGADGSQDAHGDARQAHSDAGGADGSQDLAAAPPAMAGPRTRAAAPRTWPPVVPPEILADPVIMCGDCKRLRVVPGQPGRQAGLCFSCWNRQQRATPKRRLAGLQAHALQDAKRQAAERFQAIAQRILDAAGVERAEYHDKGLRGKAWAKTKRVLIPRPTTRRRLYIVAHEAGHVAMGHASGKTHRQEYEAERYAHDAMRQHGVSVPTTETKRAKQYVAWKIHQAVRRGAKTIDAQALAWCREFWTAETKDWMAERQEARR